MAQTKERAPLEAATSKSASGLMYIQEEDTTPRRFLQAADIPAGLELFQLPVAGDCLEGAGILDGDSVAVCLTRFPRPPKYYRKDGCDLHDFCLCYRLDRPGPLLVKRYEGVCFGEHHAGTRYARRLGEIVMDASFPVKVLGVVFGVYDKKGREKWRLPLDIFPERLGTRETVTPVGFSFLTYL